MPDTEQKSFLDGVGVNVMGNWVKDYVDTVAGGGTDSIPYPLLQVVYPNEGDHAVITCLTDYDSIQSGVVELAYTTDGTTPNENSPQFVSPKSLYQNCTLTVRAFLSLTENLSNLVPSVSNAVVISGLKCQNPVIEYSLGTKQCTITCATPGAAIRYTLDGTDPTINTGYLYEGAFTITQASTVKAVAYLTGIADSDIIKMDTKVGNVFGVVWDYGQPSSALTRLTPETDPYGYVTDTVSTEPVPEVQGGQAGSSPFDAFEPWSEMKRRNFGDDGTGQYVPGAWEGEMGFSVLKDTMVYIPKFWVNQKDDSVNQLRYYYISSQELPDFELHPGSDQYVGAYISNVNNNKLESISGSAPSAWSLVNCREFARAKGYGWQLFDFAELQAIQWFYLVEFADWNSQTKIGAGQYVSTSTGGTDVLSYHTGKTTAARIRYRYIEDIWGMYNLLDGINNIGNSVNVSTDRENYVSGSVIGYETIQSPPQATSTTYPTKTIFDSDKKWIIGFPLEGGGSDSTYLCDGYIMKYDVDSFISGGNTQYGNCGLFNIESFQSSSATNGRHPRLSWKKAKASKPVFTITYTAGGTT